MKISEHEIGTGHLCFIVAEIGINHNGDIKIAKQLIDAAKYAGCQAVKFQKRTVEVVYTPEELARPRESPFGQTNGDLKRGLEFSLADYMEIDDYCQQKNILWLASPWDEASVDFLEDFEPPCYKVASACLTDIPLLQKIAATKRPVIMSTGMSSLEEIIRAYNCFTHPALLACTSTYPASLVELNLRRIKTLQYYFPEDIIGYSGHEVGLWSTLCAVVMGASIVERHITLDRSMWGTDQSASIEPHGFALLVREIRDFEKARGTGKIGIIESELAIRDKLRRMK